jgi:hypothetical protein
MLTPSGLKTRNARREAGQQFTHSQIEIPSEDVTRGSIHDINILRPLSLEVVAADSPWRSAWLGQFDSLPA